MKRTRERHSNATDELRPEYRFDYSKARPNPYAARLKGRAVAVVLDPDVAKAFPTSESVNTVLRSALRAVPRRAKVGARRKKAGS